MCFAPQRRALFRHLNLQKWCEAEVLCTFSLRNVLRATTACTFSSLIWPAGSAPAALASLLFDPPEPQIIGKTQCFATFLPFRASASSFFWLFLFSDLLSSNLSLLPASALLCFSSVHIVGSLTSKTSFDYILYSPIWVRNCFGNHDFPLGFFVGSPVLSVSLAICSILELEAAISTAFCNILEFEPLIFRGIRNILVFELFMSAWYFAPRIHLYRVGLFRAWFGVWWWRWCIWPLWWWWWSWWWWCWCWWWWWGWCWCWWWWWGWWWRWCNWWWWWWWWLMMVDDGWWWLMMADDGWWWLMMVDNGWWWLMMVDDGWWFGSGTCLYQCFGTRPMLSSML